MACSPSDVVCAIEQLTRAVQVGPSPLEVAAFVVATLGVLASTGVGIAAFLTSRQAVRIAATSREDAYRDALDEAIGGFFAQVGDYVGGLDAWNSRQPSTRAVGGILMASTPGGPKPSALPSSAALEAARLRARDDDATALEAAADWWWVIRKAPEAEQAGYSGLLLSKIRDWRSGRLDAITFGDEASAATQSIAQRTEQVKQEQAAAAAKRHADSSG